MGAHFVGAIFDTILQLSTLNISHTSTFQGNGIPSSLISPSSKTNLNVRHSWDLIFFDSYNCGGSTATYPSPTGTSIETPVQIGCPASRTTCVYLEKNKNCKGDCTGPLANPATVKITKGRTMEVSFGKPDVG
jgi:hypothetical protein